ncbi:MAG: hypothetical protein N2A42_02625, partial [Luteolibacter sp.]
SAAWREIFQYERDANRFPGEDSRKAAKAWTMFEYGQWKQQRRPLLFFTILCARQDIGSGT